MSDAHKTSGQHDLRRRLTLPLLILYGLGVTVGAGIYVLVGATAARADIYAPVSFLAAALVVAFTGFSYAELSTRFPVSAGEAAYVRNGLNSKTLSLIVGLMVAASGIVSASAVTIGSAAYLGTYVAIGDTGLILLIVAIIALAAAWGILESVTMAAVLTVIEILGLLLVIGVGMRNDPDVLGRLAELVPPVDGAVWAGIGSATLLAFFAFVGFEDLANVAEEAICPRQNMPRAIIWTLVIATLIYLAVVSIVVLTVPMNNLAGSAAPLNLVFSDTPASVRGLFNLIATIATLNGVLIQIIMASRVLYGLAKQGQLPARLAYVHPKTRTPLVTTALVALIVLTLSLALPIERLAETTSEIALGVFALVNLALIFLKRKGPQDSTQVFEVPFMVPVIGLLSCSLLLMFGLF